MPLLKVVSLPKEFELGASSMSQSLGGKKMENSGLEIRGYASI